MKIKQESGFNPVTITFETQQEAEAVWAAVADASVDMGFNGRARGILVDADVAFCNMSSSGIDFSKRNALLPNI